jgi:predicted enzyme related to lactoylglutathione lyase
MGFTPDWGEPASTYAHFRIDDGTSLALFRRDQLADAIGTADLPPQIPQQDRVLLSFEVEDLEATVAELTPHGAQFVTEPRAYPDWTIRAAYLRDPDGNLLELWTALEQPEWTDRVAAEAVKYRPTETAS